MTTQPLTESIGEQTVEQLQEQIARLQEEHTAFRANVRDVSMKYAKEHNLCSVVEQALEEAGLNDKKIRVQVTALVPRIMVVDLPEDLIAGLTEEQVAEKLTEYAKGNKRRPWRAAKLVSNEYGTPVEFDVQRTSVVSAAELNAAVTPEGYVMKYHGWDGRVGHYIGQREWDYGVRHDSYVYSLCGRYANQPDQWRDTPMRSARGICGWCERRA